jgi:hypothetical protein
MRQLEHDLLESIRQARRGEGRVTKVAVSVATGASMKVLQQTEDISVAGLPLDEYIFSRNKSEKNQSDKLEVLTSEQPR